MLKEARLSSGIPRGLQSQGRGANVAPSDLQRHQRGSLNPILALSILWRRRGDLPASSLALENRTKFRKVVKVESKKPEHQAQLDGSRSPLKPILPLKQEDLIENLIPGFGLTRARIIGPINSSRGSSNLLIGNPLRVQCLGSSPGLRNTESWHEKLETPLPMPNRLATAEASPFTGMDWVSTIRIAR